MVLKCSRFISVLHVIEKINMEKVVTVKVRLRPPVITVMLAQSKSWIVNHFKLQFHRVE